MDTFNLFPSINGRDSHTVFGLTLLKSLTQQDIQHLKGLGIEKVSDLLCYKPIHDAQLLLIISKGELAHDFDITTLINQGNVSIKDLPNKDVELIKNIGASSKAHLNALGIITIKDLAEFPTFKEAEQLIIKSTNYFSESPSAPDELIPKLKGSVHSVVRFNSFFKNRTIIAPILSREKSNQGDNDFDTYIEDIFLHGTFSRRRKEVYQIHLGYVAAYVQKWIFVNTHLGELIHSLPLAPGESRNIMMLSWTGKQAAKRYEATQTNEELSNSLYHHRALDETTEATAEEHLRGNTLVTNTMKGSSHSATFGMGNATGAGGSATIPVQGVPVNLAGLASNSTGVGTGSVFSDGEQIGYINSSTEGDRKVHGELMQNITEISSQKASNLRSLWSTIIVEDEQSVSKEAQTRNITNYNHSHALTIQYYEVLHHYRAEIELKSTTPVLFLPFNPINFDLFVIKKYWYLFRNFIPNLGKRELYDRMMDSVINDTGKIDINKSPKIKKILGNVSVKGMNTGTTSSVFLTTVITNRHYFSGNVGESTFGFTWDIDEPVKDFLITFSRDNQFQNELWTINFTAKVIIGDSDGKEKIKYINEYNIQFLGKETTIEIKDILNDSITSGQAITEIENYFKSNKYLFTKILLQNIEREQLIDIIEELYFRFGSINVYLTELIEPEPFAFANNYLLFRVKSSAINSSYTVESPILTRSRISETLAESIRNINFDSAIFPNKIGSVLGRFDWFKDVSSVISHEVKEFFEDFVKYIEYINGIPNDPNTKPLPVSDDIYLPSRGVFAEAVLGQSNASEKIDLTRFYNWQDSPIPNLAPGISNVDPNTNIQPPLPTGTPTIPNSVLNIVNPPAFPDPTGLSLSLAAIQNGNMFRDMSKSSDLTNVMANLSAFASKLAELSSNMAGNSQKEALQSATEVAKVVANMVPKASTVSDNKTPNNPTEQGGTINALDKVKESGNIDAKDIDSAKVEAAGGKLKENEKSGKATQSNPIQEAKPDEIQIAIRVRDAWDRAADADIQCELMDDTNGPSNSMSTGVRTGATASSANTKGFLPPLKGYKKGVIDIRVQMLSSSYGNLQSEVVDLSAGGTPYNFPKGTRFATFYVRQGFDEVKIKVGAGESLQDKAGSSLAGKVTGEGMIGVVKTSLEVQGAKNWEKDFTTTQSSDREFIIKVPNNILVVKQTSPTP